VARRSFRADVAQSQFGAAFAAIENCHAALRMRKAVQIAADHRALQDLLAALAETSVAAATG
jgi:hypothetical protein